jgi:hypothetical protein
MIRTLLATTAVAAVLALPVIAQDASSSMDPSMESSAMDSSMMSSEAPVDSSMMSSEMPMDSSMMSSEVPMDTMSAEPVGPFDIVTGYTQIDSDRFATRIIGQPVYDSTAADANHLGDITDIVIDEAGNAQAVIIGVGGFLGIGEKQVAVAYAALTKEIAADNTERYVVATTVEELTAAPDFVVVEVDAAGGTVPAGDAMAPAPADTMTPAPADPMAPAPSAQ